MAATHGPKRKAEKVITTSHKLMYPLIGVGTRTRSVNTTTVAVRTAIKAILRAVILEESFDFILELLLVWSVREGVRGY